MMGRRNSSVGGGILLKLTQKKQILVQKEDVAQLNAFFVLADVITPAAQWPWILLGL